MGGIDEAALDKLSLVTEMTKRIRVRSGKLFWSCRSVCMIISTWLVLWQCQMRKMQSELRLLQQNQTICR